MDTLQCQPASFKIKLLAAIVIFAASLSLSSYSIIHKQQLGYMEGMSEEYFKLAYDYHTTGRMYGEHDLDYLIFRPPGYIHFMAGVFKLGNVKSLQELGITTQEQALQYGQKIRRYVSLAQGFLLAMSAVIIFLWLLEYCRLRNAFVMAFLFGCNPYAIILAGLTHYQMLHIFLFILSGYVWSISFRNRFQISKSLVAGVFWGVTTLVRPTTLIIPVFVLPVYLLKNNAGFNKRLVMLFVFCLGMVLTIAPYTVRNYYWTKRFIPVNAQSWAILWAATERHTPPSPNHFNWWDVMPQKGAPIYQKALNIKKVDNLTYWKNALTLEDAYKKQAIKNFREHPSYYFRNCAQNFKTFNLHINAAFIKFFQVIQAPEKEIKIKKLLESGTPEDTVSSHAADIFKGFVYILQVFGFLALCAAIKRKDGRLLIPIIIYLCFCFAHTITYMDFMYYYVKIPFLFLFAGYFMEVAERYRLEMGHLKPKFAISLSQVISIFLVIVVLSLDVVLFI